MSHRCWRDHWRRHRLGLSVLRLDRGQYVLTAASCIFETAHLTITSLMLFFLRGKHISVSASVAQSHASRLFDMSLTSDSVIDEVKRRTKQIDWIYWNSMVGSRLFVVTVSSR
jgi:hypothetical protein